MVEININAHNYNRWYSMSSDVLMSHTVTQCESTKTIHSHQSNNNDCKKEKKNNNSDTVYLVL